MFKVNDAVVAHGRGYRPQANARVKVDRGTSDGVPKIAIEQSGPTVPGTVINLSQLLISSALQLTPGMPVDVFLAQKLSLDPDPGKREGVRVDPGVRIRDLEIDQEVDIVLAGQTWVAFAAGRAGYDSVHQAVTTVEGIERGLTLNSNVGVLESGSTLVTWGLDVATPDWASELFRSPSSNALPPTVGGGNREAHQ